MKMLNAEIRLKNTRLLLESIFRGNKSEFARALSQARGKEVAGSVVRRWFIHTDERRNIGSNYARLIEKATGKPPGWLDQPARIAETGLFTHENPAQAVPLLNDPEDYRLFYNLAIKCQRITNKNREILKRNPIYEFDARRVLDILREEYPAIYKKILIVPVISLETSKRLYLMRCDGDSMQCDQPITVPQGSYCLVDSGATPAPGRLVVAFSEKSERPILRQYIVDGGRVYLKPLNPRYPIEPESDDTRYCGVIVRVTLNIPLENHQ